MPVSWSRLFSLALGAPFIIAQVTQTIPPVIDHGPDREGRADWVLQSQVYQCGRQIAGVLAPTDQRGPLFAAGSLVFTSIEARDTSKLLVVNAGAGSWVVRLTGQGVNRVRFTIPATEVGAPRTFYLSYWHGSGTTLGSRFFEYSEGIPPLGHDELSYLNLTAQPAPGLVPHLQYAIYETVGATIKLLMDGQLNRTQLQVSESHQNCQLATRDSPKLSYHLQRNIDLLEMMVRGPATAGAQEPARRMSDQTNGNGERAPASVGSSRNRR